MRRHRCLGAVGALAMVGVSCGGSGPTTEDDQIAWCRAAEAVTSAAEVMGPDFAGDAADAAISLDRELLSAMDVAPEALGPDLARLRDLVVLFDELRASGGAQEQVLRDAWGQTDQPRVKASVLSLDESFAADCGISGFALSVPQPDDE